MTLDAMVEGFTSIFNNTDVGIALMDQKGYIVEANEAYCRFLGYPPGEMVGVNCTEFTSPGEVPSEFQWASAVKQGGEGASPFDRRYVRKDGEIVWGRLSFSLIRDEQGLTKYMLVVREDITSLKAKENENRIQQEIYRAMLSALNEATLPMFDDQRTVALTATTVDANCFEEVVGERLLRLACELIGADQGCYLGYDQLTASFSQVSFWGFNEELEEGVKQSLYCSANEEKGLVGMVALNRRPLYLQDIPSEQRWIVIDPEIHSCYLSPLYYGKRFFGVYSLTSWKVDGFTREQQERADTLSSYISMAMENVRLYTETQQVYLKLNQVQQESYQSQKLNAVGLLAGGMAHELNNQLSIIYACVDLSIHSLPQDGPLYRRIMKIQGAACKSANLTRQLLLFGNNQPQFKVSLDFNRDLLELKGLLERMIGKSCTLSFDLADDLRIIYADANNIEQVVINLVLNARDAMSAGGKITISTANVCIEDSSTDLQTGSNQQGSFVCLAVSDNGTGIDEENIQHLFEPFYTTKEPGDGTGLGLSVTYGIVQAHQGWIRVHSLSGEGSTFEVYLPAGEP